MITLARFPCFIDFYKILRKLAEENVNERLFPSITVIRSVGVRSEQQVEPSLQSENHRAMAEEVDATR